MGKGLGLFTVKFMKNWPTRVRKSTEMRWKHMKKHTAEYENLTWVTGKADAWKGILIWRLTSLGHLYHLLSDSTSMTWTFRWSCAAGSSWCEKPAKVYPIQCLIQGEAGWEMESGAMMMCTNPLVMKFRMNCELCAVFIFGFYLIVVFVLVKFQGCNGLFEISLEGILWSFSA